MRSEGVTRIPSMEVTQGWCMINCPNKQDLMVYLTQGRTQRTLRAKQFKSSMKNLVAGTCK